MSIVIPLESEIKPIVCVDMENIQVTALIDTGVPFSIFCNTEDSLISRFKNVESTRLFTQLAGYWGTTKDRPVYKIPELRIGDYITILNLHVAICPDGFFIDSNKDDVELILAANIFGDTPFTLDFNKLTLTINRPAVVLQPGVTLVENKPGYIHPMYVHPDNTMLSKGLEHIVVDGLYEVVSINDNSITVADEDMHFIDIPEGILISQMFESSYSLLKIGAWQPYVNSTLRCISVEPLKFTGSMEILESNPLQGLLNALKVTK